MTNGEIILQAMEHLPDEAILDAEYGTPAKPRGGLRRVITVALAAALLLGMSVTVGAYVGAGDWFKDFFETLDHKLTDSQKQFIDDSSMDIGKSVTQNGYTITLESIIMDSQRMYVKMVVEGPADVELKRANCSLFPAIYYVRGGAEYPLTGLGSVDEKYGDRMGEMNELTIVGEFFWSIPDDMMSDLQSVVCGLRVDGLEFASVLDPDVTWTVDGLWEFDFDLSVVEPAVELLAEPLTVTIAVSERVMERELRSMKLSPMGLTMVCAHREEPMLHWPVDALRAVLHDGTDVQIFVNGGSWSSTEDDEDWYFEISPPLNLDEVAYLEFTDGTKVALP